jgi:hypothetical protein
MSLSLKPIIAISPPPRLLRVYVISQQPYTVASADNQCTVTGGETLTETPLLLVNVNDVAPYLGIVDWGLFPGGLEYSVDCGDVQKVNGGCEAAAGQSLPISCRYNLTP